MTGFIDTALAYAAAGWSTFPVNGKVPMTRNGVKDATDDTDQVTRWWTMWPNANIAAAVPARLVVVDLDPRNGSTDTMAELESNYGIWPTTLTSATGGGGEHRFHLHPGGKLRTGRDGLGPGVDILTAGKYTVVPPSVHPGTGRAYRWVDPAVVPVALPGWAVRLLRPPVLQHRPVRPLRALTGDSVADSYCTATTWSDVLSPHGWVQLDPAGTRWRHPGATSDLSATVRFEHLFVYSTNTPFQPTAPGDVHGYSRFKAHAILNFNGDMVAAARHLRTVAA